MALLVIRHTGLVGRARQGKRDDLLGTGALRDQQMRELVGAGVEGRVAERGVLAHQRDGVTALRDLRLDQRRQCRLRHGARGVIPLHQHPTPLRGVEYVYAANRLSRIAHDRLDKPHETLLVISEILRAVERGIGIEINAQAFPIAAIVDEHAKVVGRAIGQVVRRRGMAGEAKVVIERLDIDEGRKKVLVGRKQVEVPPQVLIPVALVPNSLADRPSHLANERRRAHVGPHGQTQRHGVRNHAGNAAQASFGSGSNRQANDQIFNTCHAIEISRGRGDHDLRESCTADLRCRAQRLHTFSRKMDCLTEETADIFPPLIGQTERDRPIGEVLQPILAVACKSFGASIRGLFFNEERQGTERALFGRASLG
jgi:hypothetical protein